MEFKINKSNFKGLFIFFVSIIATYLGMKNFPEILKTVLNVIREILTVLKPLIYGLVIVYLALPLVDGIEKILSKIKKDTKSLSIILAYLIIVLTIGAILTGAYFFISGSLENLSIDNIYGKVSEKYTNLELNLKGSDNALEKLNLSEKAKEQIFTALSAVESGLESLISNSVGIVIKVTSNILNMFLGFVIAFYMLKDRDYFVNIYKAAMKLIFGNKVNSKIKEVFEVIDEVMSKFIRGQLIDASLVAALSSIALLIMGMPYAIFLGVFTGAVNIIPYFGIFMAFSATFLVGVFTGNIALSIYAIIVLWIIQIIDANIFNPKIVGDSIGVHTVFIIISIVIGGTYFGMFGMILAVPFSGIVQRYIVKYVKTEDISLAKPKAKK